MAHVDYRKKSKLEIIHELQQGKSMRFAAAEVAKSAVCDMKGLQESLCVSSGQLFCYRK